MADNDQLTTGDDYPPETVGENARCYRVLGPIRGPIVF